MSWILKIFDRWFCQHYFVMDLVNPARFFFHTRYVCVKCGKKRPVEVGTDPNDFFC